MPTRKLPGPVLPALLGALLLAPVAAAAQPPHTAATPPAPATPPPSNADKGLSVTTPAPMPNAVPEQVSPADRVSGAGPGGQAHMAGPANGTPFSSSPAGMQPSDDVTGPHSREMPRQPDSPNLSK